MAAAPVARACQLVSAAAVYAHCRLGLPVLHTASSAVIRTLPGQMRSDLLLFSTECLLEFSATKGIEIRR